MYVTPPCSYIAQVQSRESASRLKTTSTTPLAGVRSLDGVQRSRTIDMCKMCAHTSWRPRLVLLNRLLLLSFPASQCRMWTTSPSSSKTASASRSSTSPGGFHQHNEPSLPTTGNSFCFRSQRELPLHDDIRADQEMQLPSREEPILPHIPSGRCAELYWAGDR